MELPIRLETFVASCFYLLFFFSRNCLPYLMRQRLESRYLGGVFFQIKKFILHIYKKIEVPNILELPIISYDRVTPTISLQFEGHTIISVV